jgi:hypothetical protein
MIRKNDNIAPEVGYYGDKNIKVFGHNIYYRKELEPDIEVKDDTGEAVGIIAIPDVMKDICFTVEVLALGEECGTVFKDRVKRKVNSWPQGIVNPIKPGDRLLLPDGANSLTKPYGVDYEGLISEFDAIAIIYDDEE